MKTTVETPALPVSAAWGLTEKIVTKRAKTCVVGLGYVGLPLMVELGRAGYDVIGIDQSAEKVRRLRDGQATSETSMSGVSPICCPPETSRPPPKTALLRNL